MSNEEFIERRIIIGLVVSDDYIREMSKNWNSKFLESSAARMLASWCFDYFAKYNCAPKKDIEGLYTAQIKNLDKDRAEDIEEILSNLSHEYEREQFNSPYLLDQTKVYFHERHLSLHTAELQSLVDAGNLSEAELFAASYKPIEIDTENTIDPFTSANKIKNAFAAREAPLIRFGGALGEFWNQEMTRDAFVALMGPEKRGKTWMLIDIAMRANRSGCNVVFFQAGDMSEEQYLLRQSIYLTKHPHRKKYCSDVWVPILDCLENQLDTCDREEREGLGGIFEAEEERNFSTLQEAAKVNPDYKVCRNCKEITGAPWLRLNPSTTPLTWKEAYKATRKWRMKYKKQFRLSTYANETLCVSEMNTKMDTWEKQEDFIPDVILLDGADLLTSDPDMRGIDWRNRQNMIWQRLRAMSQQRHCLVITVTQAAASSYGKELISLMDFSEDKRKYGHVTALYGLNHTDEEKRIGIMRINAIVVREDDFDSNKPVHILRRLQIGRPVLESYA